MNPENLIALIAVLLVSQAFAGHEHECNLQSAPKGAEIMPSHGVDFISYPTELSAGYTGCSYMWLGDGTRLYASYYSNGRLVWLRGKEPKEQEEIICLYDFGKLNKDKSKNSGYCPSP